MVIALFCEIVAFDFQSVNRSAARLSKNSFHFFFPAIVKAHRYRNVWIFPLHARVPRRLHNPDIGEQENRNELQKERRIEKTAVAAAATIIAK